MILAVAVERNRVVCCAFVVTPKSSSGQTDEFCTRNKVKTSTYKPQKVKKEEEDKKRWRREGELRLGQPSVQGVVMDG